MFYSQSITELIKKRFSCRTYTPHPIEETLQQKVREFLGTLRIGPLGTQARFELIAASGEDAKALKGLGTYGFIKNPTGFLAGAVKEGEHDLEDYGYLLESAVLYTTDLGLGTCWLGGTFTKSRFARRIELRDDEVIPAVIATGNVGDARQRDIVMRRQIGADQRIAWEKLFFDGDFNTSLSHEAAGEYATVLEMVRLGPSASNKQPWRIVKGNGHWHLYVQRTPGYNKPLGGLIQIADMQRLDMGIAMCHFALTANELGLSGAWVSAPPDISLPDEHTEYIISWQEKSV